MTNFLISGSSVSAGFGLTEEQIIESFWVSTLVNSKFNGCNIVNSSIVGGDNHEIFNEAYAHIKTGKFSHALIAWSHIPRININYGFELYRTAAPYVNFSNDYKEINLVGKQKISIKDQIKQKFNLRYYNYHWDILDLVVKCNALIDVAKQHSCQLGFVNYCLPWKNEHFFKYVNWDLPSELGSFTRELLLVDERDDKEIKNLYNLMHESYQRFGNIQEHYWLNLYDPFIDHQTDFIDNKTSGHPGPKSQTVISTLLQPSFDCIFR